MIKSACIYIGGLLITGILDAVRGMSDKLYYEWSAVRELKWFLDTATNAELYQVVYPVAILGIFNVRVSILKLAFSSVGQSLFHWQAVDKLCGDHMVRSPLLRSEDEGFSPVGRFIDPEISKRLVRILGRTSGGIESFCGQEAENGSWNWLEEISN
ncbi:hypothetical protein BFJ71_g8071 [Fusarium oxysporum]|nr:hypothetical protein BFJ71_g8071 [Fusarium oxysporum]